MIGQTNSRRIIALSGWSGSGKDTVASFLHRQYGFRRLAFADRLKRVVSEAYNVPLEYFHDVDKKDAPLFQYPVIPGDGVAAAVHDRLSVELRSGYWTPRALCINEGANRRAVYANYWVSSVVEEIRQNPDTNYVLTDMRYGSEADSLKLLLPDAEMIRVSRWEFCTTSDPSERDLDGYTFDHVLNNRGSLDELHSSIISYVTASNGLRLVPNTTGE